MRLRCALAMLPKQESERAFVLWVSKLKLPGKEQQSPKSTEDVLGREGSSLGKGGMLTAGSVLHQHGKCHSWFPPAASSQQG